MVMATGMPSSSNRASTSLTMKDTCMALRSGSRMMVCPGQQESPGWYRAVERVRSS